VIERIAQDWEKISVARTVKATDGETQPPVM
jgi:hypothetical protein